MITILTGTQHIPFNRLINSVIESCVEEKFDEKIFIQAGVYRSNRAVPKNITIFDFDSQEKINHLIEKSDTIITHGGTGSIINSLGEGRKVIVMPRLKKLKEHNDDHQLEIVRLFEKAGHVLFWHQEENLKDVLLKLESFQPRPYLSDFDGLKEEILSDLEVYLNE